MSADRFNFLEFGEEQEPASRTPAEGLELVEPPQRDIGGDVLADGTPLAQVVFADPRGYQGYGEGDEDGVVTLSSLAVQAEPTKLRVVEVFGERGGKAGQFQYPTGLAVDSTGVVFVADAHNHRIQRITPGGGVAVIGGRGAGRGQFLSPQGVAVDEEDSFYVVEQGQGRVQKFTRDGVIALVFGRPGRAEGELSGATAIAIAPGSRDIFIADTGSSRVQRFDYQGRFLNVIGAPGGYFPHLSSPQALATDQGGSLYVADTLAARLLCYDPLGRLDRQIGGQKKSPVSFYQPRALATDPAGLLYVADGGAPDPITGETRGRVQCLSLADGHLLAVIEKTGRGLGALLRPGGLAVGPPINGPTTHVQARGGHSRGDLYVADTMNHRVLRFVWS